ncbi:DMT family transporter [Eubacteriales bacterium OttesenSCG-928-M02]|nr:DMT family transporter [Eubacteriales bacterium OttesenSCG-928-M02]
MERKQLNLVLLIAIIGISFAAPLIKLGLQLGVHPTAIAFYRLLLASLILLFPLIKNKGYQQYRTLAVRDRSIGFLSGLFLAMHFICWINSLSLTSTFASTALVATPPLFITIGAYFIFGERPKRRALVGGFIALIGIVILCFNTFGQAENLWGNGLALLGSIFMAFYLLCNKHLRKNLDNIPMTFLVYASSSIILLLVAIGTDVPLFAYSFPAYLVLLALAILSTLCGHALLNLALKHTDASVVSTCLLIEPLGAALLSLLFFQEVPSIYTVLGSLIVLAGVFWFNHHNQKA